ncbi:uncharacterized protein L969DRAFT_17861 [Mixia osmundae IAM 14324]|uniref:Palmitoyltransferase n=1 Tax=Mixia osmundae (strain CBS 9802 / IAM 14324 / JCM 22182 / KY 12970) TaxID=764103 RepID=G7E168_MIXOS|nr:uncharacterized protein L969DRAFT_17861 [Mixia osmundae IAM 14324]KEI38784.1 hypothetical protein L969DRAFT_17861 [Mixia osmundae IAM 14324]GAA96578.1 hypothetical protein E5Q_03247 [Mixia osmundae IAM 14324]
MAQSEASQLRLADRPTRVVRRVSDDPFSASRATQPEGHEPAQTLSPVSAESTSDRPDISRSNSALSITRRLYGLPDPDEPKTTSSRPISPIQAEPAVALPPPISSRTKGVLARLGSGRSARHTSGVPSTVFQYARKPVAEQGKDLPLGTGQAVPTDLTPIPASVPPSAISLSSSLARPVIYDTPRASDRTYQIAIDEALTLPDAKPASPIASIALASDDDHRQAIAPGSSEHGLARSLASWPDELPQATAHTDATGAKRYSFSEPPRANKAKSWLPALRRTRDSDDIEKQTSRGPRLRNAHLHQGNNLFFCGGRLMTSDDSPWAFLGAIAVVIILPALFLIFEASWLWNDYGVWPGSFPSGGGKAALILYAYLVLMAWASMARAAFSDPGIILRNLNEPEVTRIATEPGSKDDIGGGFAERPIPRWLQVKDSQVMSKWCETCGTYRPPRTSHCRLCGNCCERTDHHCTFLNNCIGYRNYMPFMAFLCTAVLASLWMFAFSVTHLWQLHREQVAIASNSNFLSTWQAIGTFIVTIWSFGFAVPITLLFLYHLRLIWLGRTTIEMLRRQDTDPFRAGSRLDNFVHALFRPMTLPSALAAHRPAQTDPRADNPAFKQSQ